MSCSICMEKTKNSITTPCKHVFCNTCLTHWLLENTSCPMCRNELGDGKIKQLDNDEDDDSIQIIVEMNDGISKRFRGDIEQYYYEFVEELLDLVDNIEDQAYLDERQVCVENGIYSMKVEFEEKNKIVSSVITYDPSDNVSTFYYGMEYKRPKMKTRKINRINSRINNNRYNKRRINY